MKSTVKIEKLDLVGLMKVSLDRNEVMIYPYAVHWGNQYYFSIEIYCEDTALVVRE